MARLKQETLPIERQFILNIVIFKGYPLIMNEVSKTGIFEAFIC